MDIVITGHVDHGKSTVIGRLLADTGSLPEGKLEQVKERCRRDSRPFEYAFLLDALKDEQAQGITIDSARSFFKTAKRGYTIIDAPGHIEFLKNMVTGASRAEAALLVIDAKEGIKENSRRHGYILSMLGIEQIAVLVNKMDLVEYDREVFEQITCDYRVFLEKIGISPEHFIPISGIKGDNIANRSVNMPWYKGYTVLDILDRFTPQVPLTEKPFRMSVQGVYKFTANGDDRRIIAGTPAAGRLHPHDEVIFMPSGKKSRVASIEAFNKKAPDCIEAGSASGFTLDEQIFVKRGEMVVKASEEAPLTAKRILASIFWLGREPLEKGREYIIKTGTVKAPLFLEEIHRVVDAATLDTTQKERIERHDTAECIFSLKRAVSFDLAKDIAATGRFVIVDRYEICGGGIIREALTDDESRIREQVMARNFKWESSRISAEERAEKYSQRSSLILITGEKDAGKKPVAKALEKSLFMDGRLVYFIGIANVLYGIDADIKGKTSNNREEHIRRLAEAAYLMLDAGCILIVTATELTAKDLEIMRTVVSTERIETVWIGEHITTDLECSLHINRSPDEDNTAMIIKKHMREKGIVFRPW